MEQELDVLGVVEGGARGGGFGGTLLGSGLAGVDALEDTQAAEVGEGDLEFADGLRAGEVVFGVARGACSLRLALYTYDRIDHTDPSS